MKKKTHWKLFCPNCLYSAKGNGGGECPKCKSTTRSIPHKFHLPSPSASKYRWKKFLKESKFFGTGAWDRQTKATVLLAIRKLK